MSANLKTPPTSLKSSVGSKSVDHLPLGPILSMPGFPSQNWETPLPEKLALYQPHLFGSMVSATALAAVPLEI
jgi:hypothetical protein